MSGDAFSFDGVNDRVDIAHAPNIFFSNTQALTLEAWFKPMAESSAYFVLKNAAYGIRWRGTSQSLLFYNGNNHFSTRTVWSLDEWYHVAVVDDGSTSVKLYVNGELDKSDDGVLWNPNRFDTSQVTGEFFLLQIGAWEAAGQFFQGLVDEVSVYDRALSNDEIREIFLAGSFGKCKDEDGDGFRPPDDCDDTDPMMNPDVMEIVFNFVDENCDGSLGECDPCFAWSSHGEYVRCVADAVSDCSVHNFTPEEANAFVTSAARSNIGKKGFTPPECQ